MAFAPRHYLTSFGRLMSKSHKDDKWGYSFGNYSPTHILRERRRVSYQIQITSNKRCFLSTWHPASMTVNSLPAGIEDAIFSTQNAASSLANDVINSRPNNDGASQLKSLLLLYTAGLWTSVSPCSLALLPITTAYITSAANERQDKNTMLPTLAFALGLAMVFTALGVSASALGGVFGVSGSGDRGETLSPLLLASFSSLVSIFMGLKLLDLIDVPLPSLDFRWRNAAFESGTGNNRDRRRGDRSLFDADGGLLLENLQSRVLHENDENTNFSENSIKQNIQKHNDFPVLLRTFLLGGTSALVASPCATPVLASLLAYLASFSYSTSFMTSTGHELWKGAAWMLLYTLGYSTPLILVGATGGQALVNLQQMKTENDSQNVASMLGQWVTPFTGGILIAFGMKGFLIALFGDPSLAGLAPVIE